VKERYSLAFTVSPLLYINDASFGDLPLLKEMIVYYSNKSNTASFTGLSFLSKNVKQSISTGGEQI
jgi:hypothetical protein